MPKQSQGGLRSRKGCWTCRDRHKKCDEQRPYCQRCTASGLACAGYGVRLTWGADNPDDIAGLRRPAARRPRLRAAEEPVVNPESLDTANVIDRNAIPLAVLDNGAATSDEDEILLESCAHAISIVIR
jgi:hypothetical protein